MNQTVLLAAAIVLLAPVLARAQSASERVEKRLAELLSPAANLATPPAPQPLVWKVSPAVEQIGVRPRLIAASAVRVEPVARKEARPSAVPEGSALSSHEDKTPRPEDAKLPAKPLIRLPSIDFQAPLPIPILGQPQKDRASLAEPALEASVRAALKKVSPARSGPTPFVPQNLPDPFEHVRWGELRHPPDEDAMPPAIPLQKPR